MEEHVCPGVLKANAVEHPLWRLRNPYPVISTPWEERRPLDHHAAETREIDEIRELLAKAERYRSYWGKEGGITVSGGEPLLQIDFLTELFQKAKERGIHTCIDTCGQPFTRREPFFRKFQKLLDYTDLLLLDIKHINSLEHQKLTHHPNENILDCARYLSEIGKPIWVRHVLVPGITDNDDYLTELRHFLRPLQNIQRIDVLPYHSLGLFKWKQRNIPYTLEGVPSPTAERVANARRILTED